VPALLAPLFRFTDATSSFVRTPSSLSPTLSAWLVRTHVPTLTNEMARRLAHSLSRVDAWKVVEGAETRVLPVVKEVLSLLDEVQVPLWLAVPHISPSLSTALRSVMDVFVDRVREQLDQIVGPRDGPRDSERDGRDRDSGRRDSGVREAGMTDTWLGSSIGGSGSRGHTDVATWLEADSRVLPVAESDPLWPYGDGATVSVGVVDTDVEGAFVHAERLLESPLLEPSHLVFSAKPLGVRDGRLLGQLSTSLAWLVREGRLRVAQVARGPVGSSGGDGGDDDEADDGAAAHGQSAEQVERAAAADALADSLCLKALARLAAQSLAMLRVSLRLSTWRVAHDACKATHAMGGASGEQLGAWVHSTCARWRSVVAGLTDEPAVVRYLLGRLGTLLCAQLTARPPAGAVSRAGSQAMARNLFAVQHELTALLGSLDVDTGTAFDRARQYYALLSVDETLVRAHRTLGGSSSLLNSQDISDILAARRAHK